LILGRCGHTFTRGQMREECSNFRSAHLPGMLPGARAVAVKFQEPEHPVAIGLLGAQAVSFDPQNLTYLVQQPAVGIGRDERSLCQARRGSHNRAIRQQNRWKCNQNRVKLHPTKAAFSPPNTC
jgi:hypothetical protein